MTSKCLSYVQRAAKIIYKAVISDMQLIIVYINSLLFVCLIALICSQRLYVVILQICDLAHTLK